MRRFDHQRPFSKRIFCAYRSWNPKFSPAAQIWITENKPPSCTRRNSHWNTSMNSIFLHCMKSTRWNTPTLLRQKLETVNFRWVLSFQQWRGQGELIWHNTPCWELTSLVLTKILWGKLSLPAENCPLATRPEKLSPPKIVPSLKLKKNYAADVSELRFVLFWWNL